MVRTFQSLSEERARPDDAFARARLAEGEYRLYARMDTRDRAHATHVTRLLLDRRPDASDHLVRAALLHDVGKAARPYRLWERVAAHLYAPRDIPAEPRMTGLRGAWQMRVHHAQYGADMVRAMGASERVAELIEEHHTADGDPEAAAIRAVDELT